MVTFTEFLVHKRPHNVGISLPTNTGLPDHTELMSTLPATQEVTRLQRRLQTGSQNS